MCELELYVGLIVDAGRSDQDRAQSVQALLAICGLGPKELHLSRSAIDASSAAALLAPMKESTWSS